LVREDAAEEVVGVVDLAAEHHVLDLHEDEDVEHDRLVGAVLVLDVPPRGVAEDDAVQDVACGGAEEVLEPVTALLAAGHPEVAGLEEDADHRGLHEPHDGEADQHALVDDAFALVLGLAVEQFVGGRVGGECECAEGVHDHVDPEQLDCSERAVVGLVEGRGDERGHHSDDVD